MTSNTSGRNVERRTNERRRAHRSSRNLPPDESWFGVIGVSSEGDDTGAQAIAPGSAAGAVGVDDGASAKAGYGAAGHDTADADARFLSRQARRIVSAGQTTFERIYAAFVNARMVLGVALVLTQIVATAFGGRPSSEVSAVCAVYAGLAIRHMALASLAARRQPRRRRRQGRLPQAVSMDRDHRCRHPLLLGIACVFAPGQPQLRRAADLAGP